MPLETGHQTDQESRSTGHVAATSVTAMNIGMPNAVVPHTDADAALALRDSTGTLIRINELR
ncbi:hypothetical protein GA0074696_3916 [Micromonospora purpureochromogenes]|uniref:Uncharacterized protein n=1 Tax=Micromonospora purpureochromogenes TaxID=47872 RepID=A0A1C4Z0I3_9ACTN|nr:hypothetical protein GA0074696_3916 [Micromonospora purpureochromogenes]